MTQKIVIKVWLDGERCLPKGIRIVICSLKLILPYDILWKKRNMSTTKLSKKAMKVAVKTPGVVSVAFVAEGKNQLVVTGEDVDAVNLTRSIRRKVGFAEILTCEPEEKEKKK